MNLPGVAIDCGWLCELDELEYDDLSSAVHTLNELEARGVPLLLDFSGHILSEYDRNLVPRSLGRRFFSSQISKGRYLYFDGIPEGACARHLAQTSFDPNDMPYVGVAQRAGGGLYLTHEEKHLEPARCASVLSNCGVTIGGLATVSNMLA